MLQLRGELTYEASVVRLVNARFLTMPLTFKFSITIMSKYLTRRAVT